jgi:hypothetical protein
MESPTKISLNTLTKALEAHVDVFICSASFEARCLSVPNQLSPELVGSVLICANENFPEVLSGNGKTLTERYASKGSLVKLSTENPLMTADALQEAIGRFTGSTPRRFVVDITTFTHEALLILLKIMRLKLSAKDTATLVYMSAGEYSVGDKPEDKWLSKGIREIRSVLGYPGKIVPIRKLHLVILTGFEGERAERFIEEYEPNRISLGVGDPAHSISSDHYSVNKATHGKIAAKYSDVLEFEFSCSDPSAAMAAIESHIARIADHNVLIAPMNTKISTIGAGLLALKDESIQLCYATAHQYNEAKYSTPGTDCYVFDFPAEFRKP